jgi:hypothetical protein
MNLHPAALVTISGIAITALAPGLAHAETKDWFVGTAAGQSRPDWSYSTALVERVDDEATAWRAFAGRRFGRHFAASLSYADLGEVTLSGSSFGGFSDRTEVTLVELTAIGLWPMTTTIEVYALVGYAHWEQDVTQQAFGESARFSASGQSASLGLGAAWWFTDALGLQLEWRRYDEIGEFEKTGRENRWDVAMLGVNWRFGR